MSREPARFDLRLRDHADYTKTFHLSTGGTVPVPLDLTDATVHAQVRPSAKSLTVLLSLDAEGHVDITDAVQGEITLSIPGAVVGRVGEPEDDDDKPVAVWDLVLKNDVEAVTVFAGLVYLKPGVTR